MRKNTKAKLSHRALTPQTTVKKYDNVYKRIRGFTIQIVLFNESRAYKLVFGPILYVSKLGQRKIRLCSDRECGLERTDILHLQDPSALFTRIHTKNRLKMNINTSEVAIVEH